MGWGIIHGTLLFIALLGFPAVNLAGGAVRSYALGVPAGFLVAVLVSLGLILNLGNEAAEAAAGAIEDPLLLDRQWAPTLVGFVVGALLLAIILLVLGYRARWRAGSPLVLGAVGIVLGGFIGAIVASTRYESPAGVVGLAITLGLITWIVVGWLLVARQGFDPEARYQPLMPRRTMEAFEATRTLMERQMQRQKDRFMGR
jgi:hypothetical protein